ncbi:MAG TPA: OsmC family protein [Steroidobacteraceae bacterium]|nr:OsmC family protein [Steroidobacteraceae bacterium]
MRAQPYPHTYSVAARGGPSGLVPLSSPGLPELASAPAREFGGPGTHWSPETLLVAAIADCYVMTFRAVSAAALFGWLKLECRVDGVLERVKRAPCFTRLRTVATLTVAPGADVAKARRLLRKTDAACLVANSLRGERMLEAHVIAAASSAAGAGNELSPAERSPIG